MAVEQHWKIFNRSVLAVLHPSDYDSANHQAVREHGDHDYTPNYYYFDLSSGQNFGFQINGQSIPSYRPAPIEWLSLTESCSDTGKALKVKDVNHYLNALLVSFAFAQAPIRGVPTKVHMSACVLGSNDNYLSLHHLSCEYDRSHAVRT